MRSRTLANPFEEWMHWEARFDSVISRICHSYSQGGMNKESQVKKRVLLHHFGSPFVLAPLLLGATSFAAAWAFDWKSASIAAFAGIAGLLAAGGIFLTRLVLRGEATAAQVLQELDDEAIADRERKLDQLERDLETSDDDPRPEKALRDLRALIGDLKESPLDSQSHQLAIMVPLHASLMGVFEHCVELLKQTILLWQMASRLSTAAARQPILAQREAILADIQKSVEQVSHTLIDLKKMRTTEISSHRLRQMQKELDRNLSIAQRTDDRVNQMMRENERSIH